MIANNKEISELQIRRLIQEAFTGWSLAVMIKFYVSVCLGYGSQLPCYTLDGAAKVSCRYD